MESKTKPEFLDLVRSNREWLSGKALAEQLALHIADSDAVVGWLWLERESVDPHWSRGDMLGRVAIVAERHFLMVRVVESDASAHITVESATVGRLRSIKTHSRDKRGRGGFTLDFAGPVFEDTGIPFEDGSTVHYVAETGWPSEEVAAFLAALVSVRR